jgi:hypothetical protein
VRTSDLDVLDRHEYARDPDATAKISTLFLWLGKPINPTEKQYKITIYQIVITLTIPQAS